MKDTNISDLYVLHNSATRLNKGTAANGTISTDNYSTNYSTVDLSLFLVLFVSRVDDAVT